MSQQKVLLIIVSLVILASTFMAGWFVGRQSVSPTVDAPETSTNDEVQPTESTTQSNITQSPTTEGLIFNLIQDGTAYEVSGYTGNQPNVTIPSTYNSKPVTRIGDSAFSGCSILLSIALPDSITEIGEFAFFRCYYLTGIVIPAQVKSIDANAFDGCFGMKSITLPDGLISIGKEAFLDCFGCSSLTIPGSVTLIDTAAFKGCNKLTKLTFNGTVAEWGAMERKDRWNWIVPATKVTCLDGTVPLDEESLLQLSKTI